MHQGIYASAQNHLRTLTHSFYEFLLKPAKAEHGRFRLEIANEMAVRRKVLAFGALNQLLLLAPITYIYGWGITLLVGLVVLGTFVERYMLVQRLENVTEKSAQDIYRLMGSGLRYACAISLCGAVIALSGDSEMLVLSIFIATGMVFGFSALNAAVPRFALAQVLIVAIPFLVCASLSGPTERLFLFVQAPVWLVTLNALIRALHQRVAQLVEARASIRSFAYHDSLTGLANRAQIMQSLESLARSPNLTPRPYILYMDLDGFKAINDTYGHGVGDGLLHAVAQRLRSVVRDYDLVGRMGGDEFIIIIHDLPHAQIPGLAQRLVQSISAPFLIDDELEVCVGLSIGGAVLTHDPIASMATADSRLYATKRDDRGSYSLSGI